ncbi:Conserved hypothetical protein [Shewanella piezotolerans WP3]|uniref:Peptidase C45 hydrolase domain-containing protein n=1 Tax=Shewanella piezotolerans (strain WP3 / JCM 13877) TaxID=225849 RepID=B8CK63_SHEPW|nr:carcinine hydrolase/isopenicillin-N N-acyltransferase family protein [Shewanella piezotolerans]ACJ27766.1 Conserved hypothetical protein [Shewanella piezotolerans WP3]
MKNSIKTLTVAVALASTIGTFSFAASAKQAPGEALDYYAPDRTAHQVGAEVVDLSGKGQEALAQHLATLHRLTPEQTVLDIAVNAVANNQAIAPKYAELMQRQAEIKGVKVHELYAAIAQADWDINKSFVTAGDNLTMLQGAVETMRGCTTLAFAEAGIVAQNNDMNINNLLTAETTVIKTDERIFLATDGGHFQGMGKHVAAVLNFMGEPSAPSATVETKNVVTPDAVFAAITASKSVEDAFNKLKDYTTPVAISFTIADDNGDHGAIEMTTNGTRLVRGESGIGHGNHTAEMRATFLEDKTELEANMIFADTFAREDAANIFINYAKERTVRGMQFILEQKPLNLTKYDSDFVTVESMVFDTKAGCAYVSGDNPKFGDYTKVCFN